MLWSIYVSVKEPLAMAASFDFGWDKSGLDHGIGLDVFTFLAFFFSGFSLMLFAVIVDNFQKELKVSS